MKYRFLDAKNCHALLPQGHGLPLARRLEECLLGINDRQDILHGSIDSLIRHNEQTINKSHGSKRLIKSPIEIAQNSVLADRSVHTMARTGPPIHPAWLHTSLVYDNGIIWKTIVPLQFLLKGWGDANSGHQCYVHTISRNMGSFENLEEAMKRLGTDSGEDFYYVGITSRNWLLRLSEHMGEMRRGSRRKFYEEWRNSLGMTDVLFVSNLRHVNLTKEEAMNWEEQAVDNIAYGPNGLNMIPGGFKGLRELHKYRIIDRMDISPEERDRAIADYLERHPKKGIPHPGMSVRWQEEDFKIKNIRARKNTLSFGQVRRIRELHDQGWSIADITREVGARNELQVKNVITAKTFGWYQ